MLYGRELPLTKRIYTKAKTSESQRIVKVLIGRKIVVFGIIVIFLFIMTAIFSPLIATHDPNQLSTGNILASPSREHLLGTDALGRDLFSRIIYGSRCALSIGLIVVGCASIIGMSLGLIAGYYGGWINLIIMRIMDGMMAFPMIVLALFIASLLGSGLKNVIIALTISLIPTYARLMCGKVISVKENDYILAAEAMGVDKFRILLHHLFPNCFPELIVQITMMLGTTILAEAGLSFLGIGITPPMIAWGDMVNEGRRYLATNPLLSFAPGVCIMLVVFAFNMLGDGLRDALDPRLRGLL